MDFQKWIKFFSTGLAVIAGPLYAQPSVGTEQLQVPVCLAAELPRDYPVLAENQAFKIVDVPSAAVNQLVLLADKVHCGRFINVTQDLNQASFEGKKAQAAQLLNQPTKKPLAPANYVIQHQPDVLAAMEQVETDNILATLTRMTSFFNRSATKQLGVETAVWLKSSFETLAAESGRKDTATYFVKTGLKYIQPSLVTVIGKHLKGPAVVIGAHMDTLDGRMPGAGDDGSGSSTLMETARVLLASPIAFKRPIYLIWYAAEERGLVGSQFVVKDFLKKAIPVKAVLQLDMTGYRTQSDDPTMWVYRDYTDSALSDFIAKLIEVYVAVPVAESRCGYGCSDHASWMAAGIPAAFPCESDFDNHNDKIHTIEDTMDRLTPEHMANFTKLALAFAIELASE